LPEILALEVAIKLRSRRKYIVFGPLICLGGQYPNNLRSVLLPTDKRPVLKFCKDLFRGVDGINSKKATFAKQMLSSVNDLVLSQEDKPLQIQTFYQNLVLVAEYHVDSRQTLQLEVIKNTIFLHFLPYLLNVCRKFEFLISHCSVSTCLR